MSSTDGTKPINKTRKLMAFLFAISMIGMIVFFSYQDKYDIVRDLVIAFIASFALIMQFIFDKPE